MRSVAPIVLNHIRSQVGPRDGLQNETEILSVDHRIELIERYPPNLFQSLILIFPDSCSAGSTILKLAHSSVRNGFPK
jgi:hypothetical protein